MKIKRFASSSGFTIVEMLIVIAIITILMAMLIPVLTTVRRRAQIKSTRALVDGIQDALGRYYIDFDEYPPSNTAGLSGAVDPSSLYVYLAGPNGKGIDTVQGGTPCHHDPYLAVPPEYVQRSNGQTLIVDAWGSPIVYLNCKAHVESGGASAGLCHNPKSFDIYSLGPDKVISPAQHDFIDSNSNGRVDEDDEGGDDITNWPMGVSP
jgi:prepilin-type N-terminal cleavage/methylation domain-containing protein